MVYISEYNEQVDGISNAPLAELRKSWMSERVFAQSHRESEANLIRLLHRTAAEEYCSLPGYQVTNLCITNANHIHFYDLAPWSLFHLPQVARHAPVPVLVLRESGPLLAESHPDAAR